MTNNMGPLDKEEMYFSAFNPFSSEDGRAVSVPRPVTRSRSSSGLFDVGADCVFTDTSHAYVLDCDGKPKATRGNPHRHGEDMQAPFQATRTWELNPGPSCCEATELDTAAPCHY